MSFYFFIFFSPQPESEFQSASASSRTFDAITLPPSSLDIMITRILELRHRVHGRVFQNKAFPIDADFSFHIFTLFRVERGFRDDRVVYSAVEV
jgi:hypothetical protein